MNFPGLPKSEQSSHWQAHLHPFIIFMRGQNFWLMAFCIFCVVCEENTALAGEDAGGMSFTNPVVRRGADPWVIRWGTNYFFCQSHPNGIWVNRAARLEDIGVAHWQRVWHAPEGTVWSKQIWAPELHFLRGKWYVYVAADDGDNASHRMYVLEGDSDDPQAPFHLKGKIAAPTDRWAIDGTVLEMPAGNLYFIWAGWPGTNDGVQNLYIAPMSNPWTISGERVCISQPDQFWENRDYPHINEGPETLWHDGKLFVIYSASGFWDDNYCLGQLTWTGGDVLDPKSWVKHPGPVFAHSVDVFGPGHCSFVKSPDGKEDWIIYHAHTGPGTSRRDVRIQPFTWNPDGSPHFGAPASPSIPLHTPSGE
jgi:GH43 family beta-xylosidase